MLAIFELVVFHVAWAMAEYIAFRHVSEASDTFHSFVVGGEILLIHAPSALIPLVFARGRVMDACSIQPHQAGSAALGMLALVMSCSAV